MGERPASRAGATMVVALWLLSAAVLLWALVDSTGLKLCGPGEWLVEKHGTRTRRSWRKLHLGVDADGGQILASTLTGHDADDGSQAGPLLDQVAGPVATFTGDGAYDQDRIYASVAVHHPDTAVIVPPRATAVPSDTAAAAPTQRDHDLQHIAEHGRMAWQKASGYTRRARAEARMAGWETGDRRQAARAYGRAPCDRGGRGCPYAQSHGGAGTPKLRPHRLSPDGAGATAATRLIGAPRRRGFTNPGYRRPADRRILPEAMPVVERAKDVSSRSLTPRHDRHVAPTGAARALADGL